MILLSIIFLIISSAETFEPLNALHALCDAWDTNMIYASNFMNVIRKFIREKMVVLGSDQKVGKESILFQYNSGVTQICGNAYSAKVLESKIDGMNLM